MSARPPADRRYYDPDDPDDAARARPRAAGGAARAPARSRLVARRCRSSSGSSRRPGCGARTCAGLDDLAAIPTTVKAELRESEDEHPPFGDYRGAPPSAAVRLGASTGTSGRPTLILWTRKDLEVDYAASARGRWRWGLRPGMSLANAHPFGMNAGGWHFSHGVEALGVLNIPSGPPVGEAHIRDVVEVWRRLKPDMYRLFGNVATTYADAARGLGLDPARDLNLTIAGDHPSEQYLMASSGLEALPLLGSACDERDGAHLAEDLAIVEVIDRHTGRALRPRRARQPGGHGAREGQLPAALRPRGRGALEHDAVPVRRDAPPALLRGPRARRRAGRRPRRCCRSTWRWSCTSFPRSRRRRRSTRSCAAARRAPSCTCASSTARRRRSRPRWRARIAERFRDRLGVAARLELVARGALPRFAYKAARVVDA